MFNTVYLKQKTFIIVEIVNYYYLIMQRKTTFSLTNVKFL